MLDEKRDKCFEIKTRNQLINELKKAVGKYVTFNFVCPEWTRTCDSCEREQFGCTEITKEVINELMNTENILIEHRCTFCVGKNTPINSKYIFSIEYAEN